MLDAPAYVLDVAHRVLGDVMDVQAHVLVAGPHALAGAADVRADAQADALAVQDVVDALVAAVAHALRAAAVLDALDVADAEDVLIVAARTVQAVVDVRHALVVLVVAMMHV